MISIALLALRGSLPFVKNALSALHVDERAQDAFEYLLVIGAVSVAVVFLMATPIGATLADGIVGAVCDAVATIPGFGGVTC